MGEFKLDYLSNLTANRANELSLVLSAMGIPHSVIEESDKNFSLKVEKGFEDRAIEEIRLYEEENKRNITRGYLKPANQGFNPFIFSMTIAFFALLFVFQSFLYSLDYYKLFLEIGNASSQDILKGEIWRCVTSITLHVDLGHFLSNAFIGSLILYFLFCDSGIGIGLFFFLLSGFLGNLSGAFIHPQEFHSVGASGAIFGAFGILTALRIIEARNIQKKSFFVQVGSAIAFLSLFGLEEFSDVTGHILGLLCGFILGFALQQVIKWKENKALQFISGFLSIVVIILSWIKALY